MKEDRVSAPGSARQSEWRGWLGPVAACLTMVVASAAGEQAQVASRDHGATTALSRATDLGPMSSTSPIKLTVWLKLRDSDGLDRTLAAQRANGAAWLSEQQIDQRHAPAAADVAAVSTFLKAQGLTVTGVGPHDLYVKATGTVASVDAAFQVQLHQYTLGGSTFHASSVKPTLPASIAPRVVSVGGLSNLAGTPMIVGLRLNPGARTSIERHGDALGEPLKVFPLSTAGPAGVVASAQCFYPPTTVSFSSSTATASYSGRVYGASIDNTVPGTLAPCGYQPSDLQTAYNLTPLYQAGLDGTGVTIAIVDAYGSTTLQSDLTTFSTLMRLPPANLQILGTPVASAYSTDALLAHWALETTLDVEWVHAIAPGAKILLVVAPSNSIDDLVTGILTASQQPGVVSISNSWATPESFTDLPTRTSTDSVLKLVTSKGISVNFATNDFGNYALDIGDVDVAFPASSPYATGVGGVSVALDENKHILFQTAWGNNAEQIVGPIASGSPPEDPPVPLGFVGGSGGGVSSVYRLPPFQASLAFWGRRRLLPDISWVADPFTGVELVVTYDSQGTQLVGLVGGTSVATPMFSALWGIAAQKAKRPLGQAAPLLYTLPPGAITDVVAVQDSSTNVTGTLTDANGTEHLRPVDLVLPLQGQATFLSALYNVPGTGTWYVITFGTDSTLPAGPGWDPATGLGTPNGVAFVDAVAP
jgi:subtilase family serine protease